MYADDTWKLIKAMLEATDADALLLHLLTICKERSESDLSRSLPYIKPPLRKFVARSNGVPESSVVFLQGDSSPTVQLVRDW